MSNFQCREWNALPFYVLYHDECTDPTLMQNWMDYVPHVLTSFMIPAEQFQEEGRKHFEARIGMGIVDKHVYSMPLRLDPPVRHVDAFHGIRCIMSLRDPLKPTAEELSTIFDYLRDHNMIIAGDVHIGIRGSDEDENGTVYYMRVLVPIQSK